LAIVRIVLPRGQKLRMTETEFAAPFRHGGKAFSVVGFPAGDSDGYYASGVMRGAPLAARLGLVPFNVQNIGGDIYVTYAPGRTQ
jgi:hypothetical protein